MFSAYLKIRDWDVLWLRNLVLRVFLLIGFVFTKLSFLWPQRIRETLPTQWNHRMWWTMIQSAGDKVFVEYACTLDPPSTFGPKAEVDDYQLSAEQIRFFYEKGYLPPFDVLTPAEVEIFLNEAQQVGQTDSAVMVLTDEMIAQADDSDKQASGTERSNLEMARWIYKGRDRHLDFPQLLEMMRKPALTERCAQLLGPNLMVWRSQFFAKQPGEQGTALHQGGSFMSENIRDHILYPPDLQELYEINCYIALTDTTEANGCLVIVPGSHHRINPITVETYKPEKDTGERGEWWQPRRIHGFKVGIDYPIDPDQAVKVEMKAGQALIFTERVIHGSLDNITPDQTRLALSFRIIRPDTKAYSETMLTQGLETAAGKIKNLSLNNWHAVLIRGEDPYGLNRLAPVTL